MSRHLKSPLQQHKHLLTKLSSNYCIINNMKIYLLMNNGYAENVKKYLSNLDVISLFDENLKNVSEYSQLIEDLDEKIIAIEPGFFEWQFPNETIDLIPNLKGIVTRSSWGNFIDTSYARSKNIIVANAPGANSQSVAEYAIFQLFALLKKLPLQLKDNFVTDLDDAHLGDTLLDKTIGILGYGKVGSLIAKLCQGMGMKVIYYSKHKKEGIPNYVELERVLSDSDVIFKTWEILPETDILLNEVNLKLLKKDALVISVFGGIGWSKDDYILIDLVEKGLIGGFSVENEHKKNALLKTEYVGNIFIPCAYAWHTKDTHDKYGKIVAESILGIVEDKKVNQVD